MLDRKGDPPMPEYKHPSRCKIFYPGTRDVQKSMAYLDSAQELMSQCDRDLRDIMKEPERRNWSQKHVSGLEPRFQILPIGKVPKGAMRRLDMKSEINLKTLEGWKSHLKKDPTWRPYICHNWRRVFDDNEEGYFADYLRSRLREEKSITTIIVNLLAKHLNELLEARTEPLPAWGDEILNSA
jgi:hypothetical protein